MPEILNVLHLSRENIYNTLVIARMEWVNVGTAPTTYHVMMIVLTLPHLNGYGRPEKVCRELRCALCAQPRSL